MFRFRNLELDLVFGHRWSLRTGDLGDAEEQQALPSPCPLHDPLQHHPRNYQRDHQLCHFGMVRVTFLKSLL